MKSLIVLIFGVISLANADVKSGPTLDIADGQYTARIREDHSTANVMPPIRVADGSGPICSYRLMTTDKTEAPFELKLIDKTSGAAELQLRPDVNQALDCHHSPLNYNIQAVSCDGQTSQMVGLAITVEDTNNNVPKFDQPWYTVDVNEGQLYTQIVRVHATDNDCDHSFGDICAYDIKSGSDLFVVNEQGVMRNTRPLNRSTSATHVIEVVAVDCGMRRSQPVLVTINVQPALCTRTFKGISERVEYYGGSGARYLMPQAEVSACLDDTSKCTPQAVSAVVRLHADHIGRGGCDREAYLSSHTLKTCNVDKDAVELLPRPDKVDARDESLATNDVANSAARADASQAEFYFFDGISNAIAVPATTMSGILPKTFSVAFWMRHDQHIKGGGHTKENILCASDDHQMNRHHMSVYVRNCKLEMLLRTEGASKAEVDATTDENAPLAEWRWTLSEVCDDQWHYYTINVVDSQIVTLFIDGRAFSATPSNPEILRDRPLHPVKDMKTRLTIGACYHSRAAQMAQYFRGQLSSMMFVSGKTISESTLQCMMQCNEQLQFNGLQQLNQGQRAVFNAHMSELTLSASNIDDIQEMLRHVAYVNLRAQPTQGHRTFDVTARITCGAGVEPIELPQSKGIVMVEVTKPPTLTLSGQTEFTRTRDQVRAGTALFPSIIIKVTQTDENGVDHETTGKHKLDACHVHLVPGQIEGSSEFFSTPAGDFVRLGLDFENDADGMKLDGIAPVIAYATVLPQIHYTNAATEQLDKRTYTIQCTMLNGRVKSNVMQVEMSIVDAPAMPTPQSLRDNREGLETAARLNDELEKRYSGNRLENVLEFDMPGPKSMLHAQGYHGERGGSFAGGAIAVIIVVCVGFLLILLVIGVIRLRNPSRTHGKHYRRAANYGDGDLQWDDTELNITVNPLEDANDCSTMKKRGGIVNEVVDDELTDEESSDDGENFDNEVDATDDDDDEHNDVGLPHVQTTRTGNNVNTSTGLEWDDSTLQQPMTDSVRSYRV